jgi:hypothetical protein
MDKLLEMYKEDELFQKYKELYDKWKTHANKKHLHIAKTEKDICLMRLTKNFEKIQSIVIDCLNSVNFSKKDSYKLWLNIFIKCQQKRCFTIRYKKEYIRMLARIKHRVSFERSLKELIDKKMLFVDKDESYFKFTPILSFSNWNVNDDDKDQIKLRIERDIYFCDEMIENGSIF